VRENMKNLTNNEKNTTTGGFMCNHHCDKINTHDEWMACMVKEIACLEKENSFLGKVNYVLCGVAAALMASCAIVSKMRHRAILNLQGNNNIP